MMAADGELQADEAAALEAFLETHPHLKAEMALYNSARLTPDLSMTYEGKDTLLKEEPARKTIAFIPRWRTYAAAAGLAALLGIGYFALVEHRTEPAAQVAGTQGKPAQAAATTAPASTTDVEQKDTTKTTSPVAPAPDNTAGDQEAAASYAAHNERKQQPRPAQAQDGVAAGQHTAAHKQQKADIHEQVAPAPMVHSMEVIPMTGIAAASLKKIPVAANRFSDAQPVAVDGEGVALQDAKGSWIDKLPIDNNKKAKLTDVANVLSSGAKKASSLKEDITDRSLSIRIEKRKLILSF